MKQQHFDLLTSIFIEGKKYEITTKTKRNLSLAKKTSYIAITHTALSVITNTVINPSGS